MLSNLNSVILEGEILTSPEDDGTNFSVMLNSKKMLDGTEHITTYMVMVPVGKNVAAGFAKLVPGNSIMAVGYMVGAYMVNEMPYAAIVAEHFEVKPVKALMSR